MNKSTKFRTALKPIITAFSALALCCSTLSYAGDDKAEDSSVPLKPYFYTGGNEDEAIRFERSILQNSHAFAVGLALKTFAPNVYRVLQDTKTYMFQQNHIALMQDVLAELKAINTNLTDRSLIPKPEPQHQRIKRLADEINKFPLHDSGVFEIAELSSPLEAVANHWNPSNNKSDDSLELVNPPNFKFVSVHTLALAQEILNRPSFQQDISALIHQAIAKALPAYAEQSKKRDDSAIDLVTGSTDSSDALPTQANS